MTCLTSWSICILCPNHRSKMAKFFIMNKRDKLYHLIQYEVCHVPSAAPCDTEVVLECHDCHSDVVLCDATSSPLLPDVGLL
jgi:hypothetical protein